MFSPRPANRCTTLNTSRRLPCTISCRACLSPARAALMRRLFSASLNTGRRAVSTPQSSTFPAYILLTPSFYLPGVWAGMHVGKPVNFAHGAPPRHSIRKRRDFYGRFPVVCPCAGAAGRGVGGAGACAGPAAGGGALRTRDPHRVSTAQLWADRRVPRLVRAQQ